MQDVVRQIYRNPIVEPVLIVAFGLQVGLGLALLARRRRTTFQTASGAYLALFLLIHVSVVLCARWNGTETNLAFAAAGLHAAAPWPATFAAYYGLAVLAVFAHISVPLGRRHRVAARMFLGAGIATALCLVLLLAGSVAPLVIPHDLIAAFP